ncbi:MAG: hypothetical protein V1900_04800 [Candidatus Aenigmatarchaeota archaeon]
MAEEKDEITCVRKRYNTNNNTKLFGYTLITRNYPKSIYPFVHIDWLKRLVDNPKEAPSYYTSILLKYLEKHPEHMPELFALMLIMVFPASAPIAKKFLILN